MSVRGQRVIHCDFEAFRFSLYLQSYSSTQSETVLNPHQKCECACNPMTFSVLFVCVPVSVCIRAAFRWLLPLPAAPAQLQRSAGRRRRRCCSLLHRPGTPAWGKSSWAATYCTLTQLKPSAWRCVVMCKWCGGHIIELNCLSCPRREVLFVNLCFSALFAS